jgi:hypothetical protein
MTKYEYITSLSIEEPAEKLHYIEWMAVAKGKYFDKETWLKILMLDKETKDETNIK